MAATNVQAFPGDVTISSNLAVDTNTLFVDSVGNKVGIGVTDPRVPLDVDGDIAVVSQQPPAALTHGTATSSISGHGDYTINASRIDLGSANGSMVSIFDPNSTGFWGSSADYTSGVANTTGTFSSLTDSGATIHYGAWAALELPYKTKLRHIIAGRRIHSSGGATFPSVVKVFGADAIGGTLSLITTEPIVIDVKVPVNADSSYKVYYFSFPSLTGTGTTLQIRSTILYTDTISVDYSKLKATTAEFSGNVGIGTNAPESILHLSASTASADITDPIKLKIHNRTGAGDWSITQPWGLLEFDTDDANNAGSGPVAGIGCRMEGVGGGDTSLCFYTDANSGDDTVLGTANERMCINSDGNVGIGTTTPAYPLHIQTNDDGDSVFNLVIDQRNDATVYYRKIAYVGNNNGHVTIRGSMGSHSQTSGNGFIDIKFSVRDGFTALGSCYGTINNTNIIVKDNTSDSRKDIYLVTGSYSLANLQITTTHGAGIFRSNENGPTSTAPSGTTTHDINTDFTTFRVDDDGNVGIGTTNPGSYKLDVNGTAHLPSIHRTNFTKELSEYFELVSGGGTVTLYPMLLEINVTGTTYTDESEYAGTIDLDILAQRTNSSYGEDIIKTQLHFTAAWNEQSDQWERLQFNQEIKAQDIASYRCIEGVPEFRYKYAARKLQIFIQYNAQQYRVKHSFTARVSSDEAFAGDIISSAGGTVMGTGTVVAASKGICYGVGGNVGIGTVTPVSTLTVGDGVNPSSGDAVGSITVTGTGATKSAAGKPGIYHRAGVGLGLWSDAHMTMQVDGTNGILEAMYIKNNGYVGIGTNNPGRTLDVRTGDIRFGNNLANYDLVEEVDDYGGVTVNNTGQIAYNISTGTATEGWCWRFTDSSAKAPGNDYFRVEYSTGNYWHKGTAISDRRTKTNFVSIDGVDALNSITKLNPLVYNDKTSKGGIDNRLKGGFIAQEVLDVIPHLVSYDKDRDKPNVNGYATAYALDYNGVFAYNVKATQEIYKLLLIEQAKVTSLEARILALENA